MTGARAAAVGGLLVVLSALTTHPRATAEYHTAQMAILVAGVMLLLLPEARSRLGIPGRSKNDDEEDD